MIEIVKHGNSGINVFTYKGQKTMQVVGVESAFTMLHKLTQDDPFTMIVELGSDYGGLTNLLADHEISSHAIIHTFDINDKQFKSLNSKIIFHHSSFEDSHEYIVSLIQSNNRVLLLCDGGNKPKEFQTYCEYLKSKDIIMAHDYISNSVEFDQMYLNKIWNWHEFQDNHITCNNLEPILQDEFKKYVWLIRMKK